MKRILLIASLVSCAASMTATPEYPKLQFAWETAQAFGSDIKNVSQPIIARASGIATELDKNPMFNFACGGLATAVISFIVKDMIEIKNQDVQKQLEHLKWQLDPCIFSKNLSANRNELAAYICNLTIPGRGQEFNTSLNTLNLELVQPYLNAEAVELARLKLYVITDKELRGLHGWLPSVVYAGGMTASALVAAHKAGVLTKISNQFLK